MLQPIAITNHKCNGWQNKYTSVLYMSFVRMCDGVEVKVALYANLASRVH